MRLLEINYLRAYAILSIVIWHCFVCPLSIWGIIQPSSSTELVKMIGHFVIPDANMPLFTYISGYLFAYLYQKNAEKYGNFKSFFKTKFERLVIPFLVLGTLVNITVPERELYMIIDGEGSHLWFCMMLFWCFMIRWAILKINWKPLNWAILLLSIAAIFYSRGSNWNLPVFPFSILGIRHAIFFYAFFVMGDVVFKNKEKIKLVYNSKWLYLISILYFFWVLGSLLGIQYISGLLSIGCSFFFIVLLYSWINKLIDTGIIKPNNYIDTLCVYSFGIYVFHEWLSWGLYHQPFFFNLFEQYTIAYAFVFTIVDFVISFTLTHYALKTKVGKYLLL